MEGEIGGGGGRRRAKFIVDELLEKGRGRRSRTVKVEDSKTIISIFFDGV